MDIARPDIKQKKKRQMFVWAGVAVVVLLGAVVAVSRLKPAAPPVDRSTIWTDTVKRGPMIRQVRGSTGTLVPREDSIQLIPAQTDATVVHIRVLPGTKVTPDTILLDMSDPELEQKLLNARLAEQQAEADYKSLQAQLQSTLMDKKITAAQVNADYTTDDYQAKTLVNLYEKQTAALEVRAGISGEAAALPTQMQVGSHVTAGTPVAEVIQLDKLKAALQIAETQAHDIQIGQPASVDTHNGIVPGHVSRIDPTVLNGTRTVDVTLDGPLPPGAVPQLSVDGTIDLERMKDVLYVGRPALGNENSTLSLFKVDPDGKGATRVPVKVGRASVNSIQVLEGLKEGDTVILSDMSRYDTVDRVRLE